MKLNDLFNTQQSIQENIDDDYILYINGKESLKYKDEYSARMDLELLQKKFPSKKFEIKVVSCKTSTLENKSHDNGKMDVKDPEILGVIKYAKNHYPGSYSDEEAFDKFIIHSLKHSKEDDSRQNADIRDHSSKIKDISADIDLLKAAVNNMKDRATSENVNTLNDETCWNNYKSVGMKKKNGRKVPNCVPVDEDIQKKMNDCIKVLEAKSTSRLRKSVRSSLPNTQVWADLDNNNNPYLAYRFGIAMAGAPTDDMDKHGPVGSKFTTIGYTSADDEITNAAAKIIGVQSAKITSKKSKEMDIVNTKSTVPDRNKLRK